MNATKIVLLGVVTAILAPSVVHAETFLDIGDLPGGNFNTQATALSGNGQAVVGVALSNYQEAFRWSAKTGMVGLGDLPGGNAQSAAYAVSYDGSTVVGDAWSGLPSYEAFRWTKQEGMVGLGFSGRGLGVSADGSVIVGASHVGARAFRWTESSGMEDLGSLRGSQHWANGVSADGTVVVGCSAAGDDMHSEAFIWTAQTGMVGLDDELGGDYKSNALAVSANGLVVVGCCGSRAFSWSEAAGKLELGSVAGMTYSDARDVSADGSIIVGMAGTSARYEPFTWNAADGMRFLRDVLTNDYGVDLSGWQLGYVTGISDDGSVIAGTGINPDGRSASWIAVVPEPGILAILPGALVGWMLFILPRKR